MDYITLFRAPSVKELERKLRLGEGNTWPKMSMICNRYDIEKKLLEFLSFAEQEETFRRKSEPIDEPTSYFADVY